MYSRQVVRKTSSVAASRRTSAKCPVAQQFTEKKRRQSNKGQRQLAQFLVCGSVFVLLVAAKLMLPKPMARINAKLSQAMERNINVQQVFSAMGNVFAGENNMEQAADQVYQAVFHPEEKTDILETTASVSVREDAPALITLREYRNAPKSLTSGIESKLPSGNSQAEISNLTYVLYSDENLPDSVSMEQMLLGFDYCTPVSGVISSSFGYREHPVEGEDRFHYGLDLAANTGTEIACFADGTVTAVGDSSSYGKYCTVTHENGYSTLYAHCDRVTVSSGTSVRKGQKIAEVGETGIATGPHLHFELLRDGIYLNPVYYVSAP
jgi:murein DD-endopeptidase MepM/ murein hydrolase activator NlpD